jgi:hypothetical protein
VGQKGWSQIFVDDGFHTDETPIGLDRHWYASASGGYNYGAFIEQRPDRFGLKNF